MKKILMIAALGLLAACAEEPNLYEPTAAEHSHGPGQSHSHSPAPTTQVYTPPQPYACDRADYPSTPQGDADYANCVIQS